MSELYPPQDLYALFEESFQARIHALEPDCSLANMANYQFGWAHGGGGKRVRPLLVLALAQAFGGEIRTAMPAAMAVETLHNATLVHDDIEDNGPLRHGVPALWKEYSTPLALNFGDYLYALSGIFLLETNWGLDNQARAYQFYQEAFLGVTRGQHLDLHGNPDSNRYLTMIRLKTGALFRLSFQLGFLASGRQFSNELKEIADAGMLLGISFQVQDDILGIWGDSEITGKSNRSDLLEQKLSLPVVYGLEKSPGFQKLWHEGIHDRALAEQAAQLLDDLGAETFCKEKTADCQAKAEQLLVKYIKKQDPLAQPFYTILEAILKRER
jgi:geranylgeranyl diphosphate synthase type I